jgi:hypothetical protein
MLGAFWGVVGEDYCYQIVTFYEGLKLCDLADVCL